jgi:UDP-N-acetylglucosamine 2-epimerase (non-hydrolysing)
MALKKVLVVVGTRPEAIKMASLARVLKQDQRCELRLCVTGQHREMLDQALALFKVRPDYDLDVMRPAQSLQDVTSRVLMGVGSVLDEYSPDIVLVQGDTTTTFSAALAAFYRKIEVGHVEAGLRTGNMYSPWPEEINRKLTSCIARFHFAPTERACQNLLREGVNREHVFITGNTVIDSLLWVKERLVSDLSIRDRLAQSFSFLPAGAPILLVTGHRRESFGPGFERICGSLKKLASRNKDLHIIYPTHPNPNVLEPARRILSAARNVHLVEPQEYLQFVYLMMRAAVILTDSGGVQEEAPSLGKPVLVMRDVTERVEAVEAGTVRMVGTEVDTIVREVEALLHDEQLYRQMSCASNPYGDGKACERIAKILLDVPPATTAWRL